MTQAFGPATLAIPGPSTVPERVLRAMHRVSPNIYEGELVEMMPGLVQDLKAVGRTAHDVAIYIANGHGTWEAALSNTLSRGDTVLVLSTGRFALGWKLMAEALHLTCKLIDFGTDAPIDTGAVIDALEADPAIKAVLCCHTDTASSVRNDIKALGQAIHASGHPALFMVDCIATLGCEPFEMDAWHVDVMVTGCQKGLMTPAGMGFVYHSPRAAAASVRADLKSSYWDWGPRAHPDLFYQRFCGTAPTHHLYGLREALNMLVHEEGVEQAWARHADNARAIWAAVDHWAQEGVVKPNVTDPRDRSIAVTTLRLTEGSVVPLRQWAERSAGVTLGVGLGLDMAVPRGDNLFRIGHMGHLNAHSVLGTLAATEAAMQATGVAHMSGGINAAIGAYAAL